MGLSFLHKFEPFLYLPIYIYSNSAPRGFRGQLHQEMSLNFFSLHPFYFYVIFLLK